jgi:hypothetical protein
LTDLDAIIATGGPWKRAVRIGGQLLIEGDCSLILGHIDADSVVTDPPYGMAYQSGYATDDLWGDERTIRGDLNIMLRSRVASWAVPRPCLMFGTWKVERPLGTRQVLIWDKGGALGMGALDIPWKPDHEEIYVMGKGFIGTRDSGSVLRCPPVQSMAKNGRVHPNEKPVALMERLIAKVPGLICDPFMGAGSTLVAAERTGRNAIGIESHPKHFRTACRRVQEVVNSPPLFHPAPPKPVQEALL